MLERFDSAKDLKVDQFVRVLSFTVSFDFVMLKLYLKIKGL